MNRSDHERDMSPNRELTADRKAPQGQLLMTEEQLLDLVFSDAPFKKTVNPILDNANTSQSVTSEIAFDKSSIDRDTTDASEIET